MMTVGGAHDDDCDDDDDDAYADNAYDDVWCSWW
jgi:hypothetical protein